MNPFTLIYDGLWYLVERNPLLLQYIKEKNKIKYDNWSALKDEINDADFPELALISESSVTNLMQTSSSTMITKQYSWIITTGDFRINEVYNQISWELFRCMIDWDKKLTALTWEDQHFVKRCNMVSLNEGTFRVAQNRGIRGWSAVWSLEVECHFATSTLRIP